MVVHVVGFGERHGRRPYYRYAAVRRLKSEL